MKGSERKILTKVVFKDGNRNKVVVGQASFQNGFVKVLCDSGINILINKEHIVFMKEFSHG